MTEVPREDFYREPRIRRLLCSVTKPRNDIYPIRTPEGDYRYQQAEEILETSPEQTLEILSQLAEAQILEREVFLRQPLCPKCKSPQLVTRHECPFCKGNELGKVILIEHLTCGHLDAEERFTSRGRLGCPSCNQILSEKDLRRNDNSFQCASCLKFSLTPVLRQDCESCGRIHNYEAVELRPVYSFKVSSRLRDEILDACRIDVALSRYLTARGFRVTSPATVRGSMGTYSIDILAKGKDETVIAHILDLGREASVEDVVKVLVPTTDVKPTKSILVAIPPLPEKVKRLAKLYDLIFLEGNEISDIVSEIGRLL